jgi:hypothetical protein
MADKETHKQIAALKKKIAEQQAERAGWAEQVNMAFPPMELQC